MKSSITVNFSHDKMLDLNHLTSDIRWIVKRFQRDNKIKYNMVIARKNKKIPKREEK